MTVFSSVVLFLSLLLRCASEASARDEFYRELGGSCEGFVVVKVQRQRGARYLPAPVPLERGHPSQWRPCHTVDHCCHGNSSSCLSPFITALYLGISRSATTTDLDEELNPWPQREVFLWEILITSKPGYCCVEENYKVERERKIIIIIINKTSCLIKKNNNLIPSKKGNFKMCSLSDYNTCFAVQSTVLQSSQPIFTS